MNPAAVRPRAAVVVRRRRRSAASVPALQARLALLDAAIARRQNSLASSPEGSRRAGTAVRRLQSHRRVTSARLRRATQEQPDPGSSR